jgi:Protein of unknown function (DUF4232)
MKPTAKTWRRATLAVAVAGASIVATSAASGATTGTAAVTYPSCPTSHLRVWRSAPGDGAAGSFYYELQFSNVSAKPCTLRGYPGVSAVDSSGHQLGSAASHDPMFAPTTIVVRPGRTAHAVLRITDVNVFPPATCKPVRAAGLRVFPPNTSRSAFVPLAFHACSQKGTGYLSVRTVRPRAGIPGYSQ